MNKANCWEYKKCGREPGGVRVSELGECPVPRESRTDGVNGGKNGGRSCWAVSGTLCNGTLQGDYMKKLSRCMECDFYRRMVREEGMGFTIGTEILQVLR